jgi:hypothetical protein
MADGTAAGGEPIPATEDWAQNVSPNSAGTRTWRTTRRELAWRLGCGRTLISRGRMKSPRVPRADFASRPADRAGRDRENRAADLIKPVPSDTLL